MDRVMPSISARIRTLCFDKVFCISQPYAFEIICVDCFPPLTEPGTVIINYSLRFCSRNNLNALLFSQKGMSIFLRRLNFFIGSINP